MTEFKYHFEERRYETTSDLEYNGYVVPKGYKFDGASIPWFTTGLFSENDRKEGILAACFHDHICEYDSLPYTEGTEILVALWKEHGLGDRWYTAWKPAAVRIGVNLYQKYS